MRIARLYPEGNGVVCCWFGDTCFFDVFAMFELVRACSYLFAKVRLRSCNLTSPLTKPRTAAVGYVAWSVIVAG